MQTPEFSRARARFTRWGETGTVDDYIAAYRDWLKILPDVPFYRDFNLPIFRRIGINETQYAWLPLIKQPLPARSKPHPDDILTDRMLLWDQLEKLKPRIILAQGVETYDVVRGMCEGKAFPDHVVLQRIGRVGSNSYHQREDDRVVRELLAALK